MATNLSVFPNQIDTFIRHSDVGSADLGNVQRYQELITKDSLTSAESEEMTRLMSTLRGKIWTAEDLNKIQDCMTNLETFFKYQSETYIDDLFKQYDARVLQMQIDINNKINEADNIITKTEATRLNIIASVNDSTYFNFDNLTYRTGFYRTIEKSGTNKTIEKIINSADKSVYATRTTVKNGNSDYTTIIVCKMVNPAVNITIHTYKDKNSNWVEQVTTN